MRYITDNEQEPHQTLRQNVHEPSNPDHLADTGIKDQKSLSATCGYLSANGLKAGTWLVEMVGLIFIDC